MITQIEALNYRCLRSVRIPLKPFHVLVGPNASGKSTFLDIVGFLRDLISEGLDAAISNRAPNPQELLFRGKGDCLQLSVEARIPDRLRKLITTPELDTARYQVAIGFDDTQRQFEIKNETLLLKRSKEQLLPLRDLFPSSLPTPSTLQDSIRGKSNKAVINKVPGGNDNFYSEIYSKSGKGWAPSFRLGPRKSALGNLIADEDSFPVATWFRSFLTDGVQQLVLNSLRIKNPSPPTRVDGFLSDGSNLPWVVARLRRQHPKRYSAWIDHLQTALPDLIDISTVERSEDKHCYMVYNYAGDYKVPSWLVSDGTLRLTALTLTAYLPDLHGIYLIEEPENGIHPGAVTTVYDSLASVYEAQLLTATHSPVFLSCAQLDDVLCFAKDSKGRTDIVLGSEHPALRKWRGEVDLGILLGSGVLG